MNLFYFWKTSNNQIPSEEDQTTSLEVVDNKDNATSESQKENIVTITYGTGMPIDVIFNYVRKDFEQEGYSDALVTSDPTYKSTKENIIRNDLKMLFTQVNLKYKNDISQIDVEIENYRQACLMSSVSVMQSQRAIFEEHLGKLEEMEHQLDSNDPRMMNMIESYRRGFLKGMAAKVNNFATA